MYFGKIVEMGDKDKIFNNPLHPYTKSLLDAIPQPDPHYESKRGKTQRYNPALSHDYKEQPTYVKLKKVTSCFAIKKNLISIKLV